MKYSHNDIIEYFKQNQDACFVAFMRTAWHSYGTTAALLSLSQSQHIKGLILMSLDNCDTAKPLVDTNVFKCLDNVDYQLGYNLPVDFPKSKMQLLRFKLEPAKYYTHHKKGSRKIYVLNPMHTAKFFIAHLKEQMPDAQIISVVVDEGLGNYFRNTYNWAIEMYQSSNSPKAFVEGMITNTANGAYKKSAKKQNELIDFNLLRLNANHYEANSDIAKYYSQAISRLVACSDSFDEYKSAIIISAQLYYETGQIINDYDLTLYKTIVNELNARGYKVVFKPHPRDKNLERYNCLNCFVDTRNTVSQESIICSLDEKPLAVLSFTSTSLVTTKLFYGVDAISLNKCIPTEKMQANFKSELDGFNSKFNDIVQIPESIDELLDIISKAGDSVEKNSSN